MGLIMRHYFDNVVDTGWRVRNFFFDVEGRAGRLQYWFGQLFLLSATPFILWIIIVISHMLIGDFNFIVALVATPALLLVGLWSVLVLGVKRLHDRDKSALWILLFYGVPLICQGIEGAFAGSGISFVDGITKFGVSLKFMPPNLNLGFVSNAVRIFSIIVIGWTFIELGLRRGIEGGNLYGDDPSDAALERPPI